MLLPRCNPLHEHLPVRQINLPDVLQKMGDGGFTGYLGFASPAAEAYLVFVKGRLISSYALEQTRSSTGFEAVSSIFRHAAGGEGVLNLFRMTPDIAICTHALLHGDITVSLQPVAAIDLKALTARMHSQKLTGTMLFSGPTRHAMAFYSNGVPIGFYHDATPAIDTSPIETQRVALLPETAIEVRTVSDVDTLLHHNFLETLNIDRLWQTMQRQASPVPATGNIAAPAPVQPVPAPAADSRFSALLDDLHEIVRAYLGRPGISLVDRLLDAQGGPAALMADGTVELLLNGLAAQAPTLDPEARIEEMLDLIRSEIAGRRTP